MKRIIAQLIIILFAASCTQNAFQKSLRTNEVIVQQANQMAEYLLKKDNNKFIDKMYPEHIAVIGSREKMDELLTKSYLDLERQSITIDSVKFSAPNPIIKAGYELQTTMIEILIMNTPKGMLLSKSTLIAISRDKGTTWFFLDTSGNDFGSMKKLFPNLSSKLKIAPKVAPILVSK